MQNALIVSSIVILFISFIVFAINKFNKKENEKIDVEYEKEKLQSRIDSNSKPIDDVIKRVSERIGRNNDKKD